MAAVTLLFLLLSLLIATILTALLSYHLLARKYASNKSRLFELKLPPGPPAIPILGNMYRLVSTSSPHQTLRDLARSHGPVMLLRAGNIKLLVLSSSDAAKEVMKVQDAKFSIRPTSLFATRAILYNCEDIAFSSGPYWRHLRRICATELLSLKQVKSFSSIRLEEIRHMLKTLSTLSNDGSPVNLGAKLNELSNNIVLRAAFGRKYKIPSEFLRTCTEAVHTASWLCLSDYFPSLSWLDVKMRTKLARIHRDVDDMMEYILQEHLNKPKAMQKGGDDHKIEYDLVDILIKAKESNDVLTVPLTSDNIKAVIMDIFTGGTETSSGTIEWAMSELIKNPAAMKKAQAEVRRAAAEHSSEFNNKALTDQCRYLKLVIKETLRLHPPAPLLLPRLCKEECELFGYTIPSGTFIVVNAWALGRSDDYWKDDAERFVPERFENCSVDFRGRSFEFVPFGAGRRICPGIDFGMAVVEEALAMLLLHFDWKLPGDHMRPEELDMREAFGAVASRKEPLCLVPVLCVPLLQA